MNSDEIENFTLSYFDQNCVIIDSVESNRRKRSENDHVTEMTLQSDVTFEIEGFGI